ncbi:MAG: 3-hydroxybutyryl-CoA dehydrogenase [Clostridiaceae bacterium]|jgi:3-hydroxybutyryl-CoA dehydrogenase|nr:3-hydroxyacyl-CoA dehydrogenase NAD-binding domain-containing protein [Eubacteriales bacterium]NLV47851.1 3-hydroxybutyryl-CoA dehydrogenase [Clostridiaceae bacterium]
MKIGVVGVGTMGSGIAQVFAQAGYSCTLVDLSHERAIKGKERIAAACTRLVQKGRMTADQQEEILNNIQPGELNDLQSCSLVIEAIQEDMLTKKALFKSLVQICPPDTLFASNTSALSLTELSADLDRPVIGMHFFNPAPVMQLVEIVSGLGVSSSTIETLMQLVRDIGKTPIQVNEAPGFVVNRILIPMINEAITVLFEGTATAEAIDSAMKLGANHPIGPLSLADLIGNDVVLAIMNVLYEETGDSKYRPCPLLKQMVRARLLGRKTGRGFFDYENK